MNTILWLGVINKHISVSTDRFAAHTFCEASLPSRRLTQDRGAADTQHDGLSVTEHCGDFVAACRHTNMVYTCG